MGTVADYRRGQTEYTKILHKNKAKEFYLVLDDYVQKYTIPEKFRKKFKEQYDPMGGSFKDTAEFVEMIAIQNNASLTIMDFEIDYFIEQLKSAKDNEGYDLTEDWG